MLYEKPSEKMLKQIECGSVIYIKHQNKRGQDLNHYTVVCNQNPQNDNEIVLAVITSDNKGPNLIPTLKKNYGESTIISVPSTAFRKLTRLSFINCNLPVFRNLSQLCNEVDSGEASFYHPGISDLLRISLSVRGMLESKLVTPEQKNYIKEKCSVTNKSDRSA